MDGAAAREAIRALIEKVVAHACDARSGKRRTMQLYGVLFEMLASAASAAKPESHPPNAQLPRTGGPEGVVAPLVAGTGGVHDLRKPQVEMVAGARSIRNLRSDIGTLERTAGQLSLRKINPGLFRASA